MPGIKKTVVISATVLFACPFRTGPFGECDGNVLSIEPGTIKKVVGQINGCGC
jgi:hypothetical protein